MARITQTRMGTKGKKYSRSGRYKYRSGSLYRSRGARWTPDRAAGSMPALSVSRGVCGFPTEIRTSLRYSDVITLTSTANAVANHVFRMNSLFDPDFTGTDINHITSINWLQSINDILLSDQSWPPHLLLFQLLLTEPEQRSWMAQYCVQYGEILLLQTQLRCLQ